MKMKSPVMVVLISLACLFAIFHSCQGLRCYSCKSKNYVDEKCEKISGEELLFDYGKDVENCIKVLIHKKDKGEEKRTLIRAGFSDEVQKDVNEMIKMYKDKGYEVDYFTCKEDKCNGK